MRTYKSLGTTVGLSLAALATSGWLASANAQAADQAPPADSSTAAPADAAPAKPMHHKHSMHHASMSKHGGDATDAAVEDLNARSLDAAKGGKPFSPTSAAPAEAPKKTMKPMHHHHHMMKAPAKPADDAAAPAPAPDAPK